MTCRRCRILRAPRWRLPVALVFGGLGILAAVAVMSPVPAQEPKHHHRFHIDFYSKWQRPNGMGSCCNARVIGPEGREIGDCEPSEAHVGTGDDGRPHWFARLPHAGDFIEIPDRLVIHERNPEQGGPDGHLCWTAATGVLCFVPPDTGG